MTDDEYRSYYEGIFSEISLLTEKKETLEAAKERLMNIYEDEIKSLVFSWLRQLTSIDNSSLFEGQNEKNYTEAFEDIFSSISLYQASILDMVDVLKSEIAIINKRIEELEAEAHNALQEAVVGWL